jgi:CheY-like chemotaxis protein
MSPRVLVVEDDPDLRALLATQVERLGCTVVTAGDGEEVLVLDVEEPLDVVVVDIQLVGIDGCEVVRRLRAHPRTPSRRVVVTSVLDREDYAVRADVELPKPFSAKDVAEAFSQALGG